MDCCGAGRAFEAFFDMLAFFWWLAGAITLTVRCVFLGGGTGAERPKLASPAWSVCQTLPVATRFSTQV